MTKKHYIMIAARIKAQRVLSPLVADTLAVLLADDFAADNPRFNRPVFLAACGVRS